MFLLCSKFRTEELHKLKKSDLIISYYTIQFIDPKTRQKIIEKIYENDADNEIDQTDENITTKEKNISFINFLLVGIISFVAIVILVDTFKNQIAYVIPNISLYINELHEILRDIFLFIADLSK